MDDVAGLQAEQLVDGAHFLRVAADQIIIDGDDMYRPAPPAPDAGGQGGGKCFALTCGHFRNVTLAHRQRPDDLHGKRPQADAAKRGFAHDGKGAIQQVAFQPAQTRLVAEFRDRLVEMLRTQVADFRLQRFDALRLDLKSRKDFAFVLDPAREAAPKQIDPLQLWAFTRRASNTDQRSSAAVVIEGTLHQADRSKPLARVARAATTA